jgi:hypothetical protein
LFRIKQNARPDQKDGLTAVPPLLTLQRVLHGPLTANSQKAIGGPDNAGLAAQTTRVHFLHLSGSKGNFSWVQQGVGLSLARTALSASTSLLSFFTADAIFLRLYYR